MPAPRPPPLLTDDSTRVDRGGEPIGALLVMMMVPIKKRFGRVLRSCVESRMMTALDMMKPNPLAVNAPSIVTGVMGVYICPKRCCQNRQKIS